MDALAEPVQCTNVPKPTSSRDLGIWEGPAAGSTVTGGYYPTVTLDLLAAYLGGRA
jgi:hypothetical protein